MCKLALFLLLAVAHSDDDVIQEYDRRQDIVSRELAHRRQHVRARLRALYQLERGGYARLLAEAGSRDQFFARRAAASRVLARDLAELRLYASERAALRAERSRLEAARAPRLEPAPALALRPPVAHVVIVGRFGGYDDPESGLELERRGLVLLTRRGEVVRAPAAGRVRFVGEVPELGQTVVIEHDGGIHSVAAGLLGPPSGPPLPVAAGAPVAAGQPIGTAAGTRLGFQIRRGVAPLDPEPLLRHTGRR